MLGHSRLVWLVLSYSVVQAGPKLIAILLLQSPKCGDYHAWLLISFDRPSVGGGGLKTDKVMYTCHIPIPAFRKLRPKHGEFGPSLRHTTKGKTSCIEKTHVPGPCSQFLLELFSSYSITLHIIRITFHFEVFLSFFFVS